MTEGAQDSRGSDGLRVAGVVLPRPIKGATQIGSHSTSWLSWGDPTRPTVVLVHGGAAHAWWWSLTAVLLSDDFHVVALDLSGHGSSDRRARYSYSDWVDELLAVALPDQLARPVVVGHSMGGIIASLAAAHQEAHRLAGIVIVDAPVVALDGDSYLRAEEQLGVVRTYPDRESAVAAFQLRPRQPIAVREFYDFVAQRSVRLEAGTGSWTWRYDPRVFAEAKADRPMTTVPQLRNAPCPVTVVVGERSTIMTSQDLEALRDLQTDSDGNVQLRVLPGAAHHLMFDDPWGLATALGNCASRWTSQYRATTLPG